MGSANFYVLDGTVKNLPCTVRRFVFDDINLSQADKNNDRCLTLLLQIYYREN